MKKKEALSNSFGSSRRNKKPLSADAIEKIIAEKEAEKTIPKVEPVVSSTKVAEPVVVKKEAIQPVPLVVKKPTTKTVKPKTSKTVEPSLRKRRKSEDRANEEREIKTSFDIPESLYDDMRIYLIRQKKSMREYLLELIKKDLGKK